MELYQRITSLLESFELSEIRSRVFDNAYRIFEGPAESRRLIVVGLNGNLSDSEYSNLSSVEHARKNPGFCNVTFGLTGGWGRTNLPKNLVALMDGLGYSFQSTVFTNAILMCSKSESEIRLAAREQGFFSAEEVISRSMSFFEEFTVGESRPELIVAYGNGLSDMSTANVIYRRFGVSRMCPLNHSLDSDVYSFLAMINGQIVPVVCIRHMSRFKPCIESIKISLGQLKRVKIYNNQEQLMPTAQLP